MNQPQSIKKRVAVVGGGIAGLTAALRLAESGFDVELFEAAPALGGRTKSFYDEDLNLWVDNGPHILVGAYHATKRLLADVGAENHVSWQPHLTLPLWDADRSFFSLEAASWLPVGLALVLGVYQMPKHDLQSVKAMMRLALTMTNRPNEQTVAEWLDEVKAPESLRRDMLEVLCLGVMNEPLSTANAKTFALVLATAFSSHSNAKMGWFNKPLSQALVEPLRNALVRLNVIIELRKTVRNLEELNHDAIVLAIPLYAKHRLLGINEEVETQSITNIHLWFDEPVSIKGLMLGMLGTYSQWLFHINAMTGEQGVQHLCVTVSADLSGMSQDECAQKVLHELAQVVEVEIPAPSKIRFIREKRATVVVREHIEQELPKHVFDACESPRPGELPATIELAVISGEKAANMVNNVLK